MSSLYSGNRFRKALCAFVFGRAVQGIASLVLILLLVRLFTSTDYGAYMVLWGMTEMMVPLSSLGLLEAVRRFLPELAARGTADSVKSFVMWASLIRAGILVLWCGGLMIGWETFAVWLGFTLDQAEQAWLVVVLAISIVAFRYVCEMLESLLEQRWSQLVRSLHPIGRLLGLVCLALVGQVTLAWMLWLDVVVSLVCLLLAGWALTRKLNTLTDMGDYQVKAREVVEFAWHLAGVNLMQSTASEGAQRLLIARLLGLEAAGLFSFLQQLQTIVSRYMPTQLLSNILRPMLISRLAVGEPRVVSQSLALMWKGNQIIVLACVVGLMVAGDELVTLLSSGKYSEAGLATLILFIGLGATSQGQIVNMAMQIHDKTGALLRQSVLFLILPLGAWLGSSQGVIGFIAGVVVSLWLRNSFALWWMRRQGIGIDLDKMGILSMLISGVIACGTGVWLEHELNPWICLLIALLILVVGVILFRPLSRADGDLLIRVFKSNGRFLQPLIRTN
ncbi:lipopolysaccharide biosynthesis protein [Amphritea pacifica]|uniref:lipopolysaccharide biosynthesis protein n=1 Tax=Amphritea pacifica TaxID=2811233 RepID=UPI001965727F|nr:oligosaccharide flippase family protein [Amphritea pacifica]MBN1008733.1 oligosaccharide flippase family protein [Amphritea pacifica]